jgi:hypothetical protein
MDAPLAPPWPTACRAAGHHGPVGDLAINLLASVITGAAVWVASWLGRRWRTGRMRAFFGVEAGGAAMLVVGRHAGSPKSLSVHLDDATAVVEMAAAVLLCGGRPDVVGNERVPSSLGSVPEFCVGGPTTNARTSAHLRMLVPGVRFASSIADDPSLTLTVGTGSYPMDGDTTYAVVAKVFGPGAQAAPVFVIAGQLAAGNRAAVRYLATNHRELARRHGVDGRFALLLRLRGARVYGPDSVEHVEDVTAAALS